jgi:hypothetical protein
VATKKDKGPDITSTSENPDYETHVGRVQGSLAASTPRQRIAGGRWYRGAFQDAMHIAHGVEPGVKMEHPDPEAAAHGIEYRRNKDRSVTGTLDLHNRTADNTWHQQQHANSHLQGQQFAETGRYPKQQVSHANDQGRPWGQSSMSERVKRSAYTIAALSPAGPTGMDWANNSQAAYDLTKLKPEHHDAIKAANALPAGSPDRKEASATAREPFKGKALNHATTANAEKALDIHHGSGPYDPSEHFTPMKTKHFGNDIYSEHNPAHELNNSGETGTADKHMIDVMSGTRTGWGKTDKETGYTVRGDNTAGLTNVPKETTPKGYAYHRDVIQEASRREGMRPKVGQASSWVQEKESKEADGDGRNGRGARAANRNISEAQFG